MSKVLNEQRKIRVGITTGDINGIGYEIIIKALSDQRMCELFTPVVYGTSKAASYHRKTLNTQDFNFHLIRKADQAHISKPNLLSLLDQEVKIDLGQTTETSGEMAVQSLEAAVTDLKNGLIDALVTAPISKKAVNMAGFDFPGHTEFLASRFDCDEVLMLMVSRQLRIGMATGHIALKDVSSKLSVDLLLRKINLMHKSLVQDFAITGPRIAVLALNPHAGDEAMFGTEEKDIIAPAIERAFSERKLVFGPFPSDGFFGSAQHRMFDGILAMYHDQGMLPFKCFSFDTGVNFTAGMPVVRTSPAHGTAFDIAGKDKAMPDSMREALYLACDIFRNRMEYLELTSNPLEIIANNRQDGTDNI